MKFNSLACHVAINPEVLRYCGNVKRFRFMPWVPVGREGMSLFSRLQLRHSSRGRHLFFLCPDTSAHPMACGDECNIVHGFCGFVCVCQPRLAHTGVNTLSDCRTGEFACVFIVCHRHSIVLFGHIFQPSQGLILVGRDGSDSFFRQGGL